MSATSNIEWTDATWNVLAGCDQVSTGCAHCYAERMAFRLRCAALAEIAAGKDPGRKRPYIDAVDERGRWTGLLAPNPEALGDPLRWRRPRKIFVCSTSDLFHENVPDAFIDTVFAIMALCRRHTFQVLTKRPERMAAYLHDRREQIMSSEPLTGTTAWHVWARCADFENPVRGPVAPFWWSTPLALATRKICGWPLRNVWLGTSVETQKLIVRVGRLEKCPAAVRFLSIEPLLERIHLKGSLRSIGWVIVGGESGPGARPMHPEWVRQIRDDCQAAGVRFFFKQWGEWGPAEHHPLKAPQACRIVRTDGGDRMVRVGKAAAGRILDGREWSETPGTELDQVDDVANAGYSSARAGGTWRWTPLAVIPAQL